VRARHSSAQLSVGEKLAGVSLLPLGWLAAGQRKSEFTYIPYTSPAQWLNLQPAVTRSLATTIVGDEPAPCRRPAI
jgi:hypothetical protein